MQRNVQLVGGSLGEFYGDADAAGPTATATRNAPVGAMSLAPSAFPVTAPVTAKANPNMTTTA
jgi:hypothetical protein